MPLRRFSSFTYLCPAWYFDRRRIRNLPITSVINELTRLCLVERYYPAATRIDLASIRPFVLPSIRPNDISLRLERRGVVVSALALCLPYNSNDVYRSCYRGTLFLSSPFFSVQFEDARLEDANTKESPNSSWWVPFHVDARAHRRETTIKRYIHLYRRCTERSVVFIYRLARLPGYN